MIRASFTTYQTALRSLVADGDTPLHPTLIERTPVPRQSGIDPAPTRMLSQSTNECSAQTGTGKGLQEINTFALRKTSSYQPGFSTHNLTELISFPRIHSFGRNDIGPSLLCPIFLHESPDRRKPLKLLGLHLRPYAAVWNRVRLCIRLRRHQ